MAKVKPKSEAVESDYPLAGNDFNMKFKTPESRKVVCASYIAHVESGLSDECFPDCDMDTFHRYERDFPEDFPTDLLDQARRIRRLFWERAGRDGTIGKIKGFNSKSWQFNMMNRFMWNDRRQDDVNFQRDGAADLAAILIDDCKE